MNGTDYMILAYVAGLGLLWGYAAVLWWGHRRHHARRHHGKGGPS